MVDLESGLDQSCGQLWSVRSRVVMYANLVRKYGDVYVADSGDLGEDLFDIGDAGGAVDIADEEDALERRW